MQPSERSFKENRGESKNSKGKAKFAKERN